MKKKKNSWKKITITIVRTTPRSTGEFSEFSPPKKKGGGGGGGGGGLERGGGIVSKRWVSIILTLTKRICAVCLCVLCLFTPFVLVFSVFHGKNLAFVNFNQQICDFYK